MVTVKETLDSSDLEKPQTYYTYRISSLASDKYYFGVRQIKIADATIEDCLTDKYLGSGGNGTQNKFYNWKRKHRSNLVKEIVARFTTKEEAYAAEAVLVGDLWRTDKLCLNSCPGGLGWTPGYAAVGVILAVCELHGETKHQGSRCRRCVAKGAVNILACPLHGETKHRGDVCCKCIAVEVYSVKECAIHGEATHIGDACVQCRADKRSSTQDCLVHGSTAFHGKSCIKCYTSKSVYTKECDLHGLVPHQGDACAKCTYAKVDRSLQNCTVHGKQEFFAGKCRRCWSAKNYEIAVCGVHGEVKHRAGVCAKCSTAANVSVQECSVHGFVKHRGAACYSCTIAKSVTKRKLTKGY